MIRDAKEARRCFEREREKAKLNQRKKGEIVDPEDIQVKEGLEIPVDDVGNQLPSPQPSLNQKNAALSKRSTIRTVRR